MPSIKIDEIDAAWLAENVNGKVLLKAVGLCMGKKRGKKSGDGASVGSREVSAEMQLHHDRTSKIAKLCRDFKQQVKDEEREFDMDEYPKGAHLRVVSYLKSEDTIDQVIYDEDVDAVEAALNFLVENPDWQPEGKPKVPKKAKAKAKAKKSKALEVSDSESEEEKPKAKAKPAKEEKPKAAPKPAKEEKPKKAKALELSDSESEEDKPKPKAKPAKEEKPKAAAKPLEVSDSESEEEKPKPKAKPVKEEKPKAVPKPVESDSEDEKPKPKAKAKVSKAIAAAGGGAGAGGAPRVDDFVKIQYEGKDYSWDQDGDGALYEGTTRVGSFDGTKATFDKA